MEQGGRTMNEIVAAAFAAEGLAVPANVETALSPSTFYFGFDNEQGEKVMVWSYPDFGGTIDERTHNLTPACERAIEAVTRAVFAANDYLT
jgi:hypothetical protein